MKKVQLLSCFTIVFLFVACAIRPEAWYDRFMPTSTPVYNDNGVRIGTNYEITSTTDKAYHIILEMECDIHVRNTSGNVDALEWFYTIDYGEIAPYETIEVYVDYALVLAEGGFTLKTEGLENVRINLQGITSEKV